MKIDRFKKIVSLVNSNKKVSLSQLEKTLEVSRITIQRDLTELENRKLLRRFHGGAMSLEYSQDLYDNDLRETDNAQEKKKIAAKAAALILEESYIGLDSSPTVYYLSETIFPGNVLVLTPSIDCFNNLIARDDLQVVLAGGRINRTTKTLTGPEAIDTIRKFNFDQVFISAGFFIPEKGFFDLHAEEVQIKRALIESSKQTIMLINSTSLGEINGVKVCASEEVHLVITDDPDNPELRKVFKEKVI